MMVYGANYIAGEASQKGDEKFTSVNPRTRSEGNVAFHNATQSEIDLAVRSAADAFQISRNYSARKLADFLDAVADEIEALGDELLETADMETGLGLARLTGERGRTTGQLRSFGNLLREGSYVEAIIDTAIPDRQPAPRPDIRRMLFPIGVVAVFGASNFPLAFSVAGGDTASAFAAGCPVIVKAHPGHPATSELVAQAINTAVKKQGFPAGFFSLVQGNTIEVGQELVKHPQLDAVGFTGSLRGGRALFDTASSRPRPIPVYAEMGSINPIVILPDAIHNRGESIAEGLVGSVTLGSGQFCTNPGLVLVLDNEESRDFVQVVSEKMKQTNAAVLLNASVEKGLDAVVQQTIQHDDVSALTGGEVVAGEGYCFANTVLSTTGEAFLQDSSLQVEHFGPVTMFVLCRDMVELQEAVKHLHGNLTSSIHADESELESAGELFDLLRERAGRLILNGYPTGVEVVHAMQHGGPYPATTAPATTSVGMTAIKRFMRPVAFQNLPDRLLPAALQDANPLHIWRIVDDEMTNKTLT